MGQVQNGRLCRLLSPNYIAFSTARWINSCDVFSGTTKLQLPLACQPSYSFPPAPPESFSQRNFDCSLDLHSTPNLETPVLEYYYDTINIILLWYDLHPKQLKAFSGRMEGGVSMDGFVRHSVLEVSANHPRSLNTLKVKTPVTVRTRRQKRMAKGRMLARRCHVLLRDTYAPIRSTTTWSAICSSGSASSFQWSIPF